METLRRFRKGLGDSEKKMDYQQAWAHFVKVAKRDEAQRPLGSRPLSHATIQKAVQKVGLRVGIRINPRSFRHTYAMHLLDNGADLRTVQELMVCSVLTFATR